MNEKRLMGEIENSIIRTLHKDDVFKIDWQNRIDITEEARRIYSKIDYDRIFKLVKEKIEETVANKIVSSFTTEIATDIKSMYANKNIREDIRYSMRKNIELVLDKLKK